MTILAHRNDERIEDLTANDEPLATFSWGVNAGLELDYYNGAFKILLVSAWGKRVFDVSEVESLYAALTEAVYIMRAMQDTDK